jgi:ribosomal protein S18 acetylase RimI-like enzyme
MEMQDVVIRRELRRDDLDAIIELHDRVYRDEYGAGEDWVGAIRYAIEGAVRRGWPRDRALGSVWLVDHKRVLNGSLALVLERPRVGNLDWFVLAPEVRGRGIGRHLVSELLADARSREMRTLKIRTFSALTAAARIYRDAGFRVVWERPSTAITPTDTNPACLHNSNTPPNSSANACSCRTRNSAIVE